MDMQPGDPMDQRASMPALLFMACVYCESYHGWYTRRLHPVRGPTNAIVSGTCPHQPTSNEVITVSTAFLYVRLRHLGYETHDRANHRREPPDQVVPSVVPTVRVA